jgi:hypothetical protein
VQVYEDTSSNPLGSLRRTSRVCRRECERLLFRSISLGDTSEELRLKSQRLLKRLQDPNNELADHVRELQLGPFADGGGYFANKALLHEAVDGTSMPYSTWFSLLQRTLYKAMPSPVADEPKSLASWEQDEKDTNVALPELTPRLLSRIQQLVRDPESMILDKDSTSVLGNDEGYVSPVLERAIRNITNLRSLTWLSNFPFPRDALRTLQQTSPSAKIALVQPLKTDLKVLPIDCTLLASPQLYSADVWIHCAPYKDPKKSYNEYRTLKRCLAQGNSIKKLTMTCDQPRAFCTPKNSPGNSALLHWARVTHGPMNFDWQEGDRFPALEELTLPYTNYYLSADHCDMWTRCMDWTRLVRLDVGHYAPQHLFTALTGRVTQLQYLRFGNWPKSDPDPSGDCKDMAIIKQFLSSITALRELSFSCHDCRAYLHIFEAQKLSLRRLKIEENHRGFGGSAPEERDVILRLLLTFRSLTSVEFAWAHPAFIGDWVGTQAFTPRMKLLSLIKNRQESPAWWFVGPEGLDLRGM